MKTARTVMNIANFAYYSRLSRPAKSLGFPSIETKINYHNLQNTKARDNYTILISKELLFHEQNSF